MKKLVWTVLFPVGILLTTPPTLAQQFRVDTLVQNSAIPVSGCIAFVPGSESRFFFAEDNGRIRMFDEGRLRTAPFATVPAGAAFEKGVMGIAVHPRYPDSPFVYVLFARRTDGAAVLMRYSDSSGMGVNSRTLLAWRSGTAPSGRIVGNCHFGPDGKLYIAFGENTPLPDAQDTSSANLRGKILRLNDDGSLPDDNPDDRKLFWSIGHAATRDFTWDNESGRLYCLESRTTCGEAIFLLHPGTNLGWPEVRDCNSNDIAYPRPLASFSKDLSPIKALMVYEGQAFPRLRGRMILAAQAKLYMPGLPVSADSIVVDSLSVLFSSNGYLTDARPGPDGNIYLTYRDSLSTPSSGLIRLRPVAPAFSSTPLLSATQGVLYHYAPSVSGTEPYISLVTGPEGMMLDQSARSLEWKPTNEQALRHTHQVVLRAENGAGAVDQAFVISVANVNDPPGAFSLTSPAGDTTFVFAGTSQPSVFCTWTQSFDPDLDTVRYVVEVDTAVTFDTPAWRDTSAGLDQMMRLQLPLRSGKYYWRVRATDGQAAVFSSDVRRFEISMPTALQETQEKPKDETAVLEQNFPNPFNPSTTIQYTIPKGGFVRLTVFNLLGQEVARLFEGTQSAGTYEFTFNKESLPTGIYFYRIQAPGFAETRKMIITK